MFRLYEQSTSLATGVSADFVQAPAARGHPRVSTQCYWRCPHHVLGQRYPGWCCREDGEQRARGDQTWGRKVADTDSRCFRMPTARMWKVSGVRKQTHLARRGRLGNRGCREGGYSPKGEAEPTETLLNRRSRSSGAGCSFSLACSCQAPGPRTGRVRPRSGRRYGTGRAARICTGTSQSKQFSELWPTPEVTRGCWFHFRFLTGSCWPLTSRKEGFKQCCPALYPNRSRSAHWLQDQISVLIVSHNNSRKDAGQHSLQSLSDLNCKVNTTRNHLGEISEPRRDFPPDPLGSSCAIWAPTFQKPGLWCLASLDTRHSHRRLRSMLGQLGQLF